MGEGQIEVSTVASAGDPGPPNHALQWTHSDVAQFAHATCAPTSRGAERNRYVDVWVERPPSE